MRMEIWHPDMIRFMRDASEYGSYHQRLLEKMLPALSPDTHICDAGSGLGNLSLALAPHVRQVTAVEMNPDAAGVLRENCQRLGISNIRSCCADMETLAPDEMFDAMVFCFFGESRQILRLARRHCRGRVFVFTRNYRNHRFSAGDHDSGREGYPEFRSLLRDLRIDCYDETFTEEFGQPFRSRDDARRFFEMYSCDPDKNVLTEEFLTQRAPQTGREDFPFYMPHEKNVAFFTFLAKDIPEQI